MDNKKYDYDDIKSLSDYIKDCLEIIKKYPNNIIVFRGETQNFEETACIPGLFRKNYLDNNPFFEKNLLDEMTANGIAKGNTYLEKAINAQHDGFPSRLLDVSYNSLIGLQFAVTPYYKYKETCDDDKDGVVYVFHFENSFCATGDGIRMNYDEILKKETDWYEDNYLFSKNYKFIDHMRINERIKAQNGAFILFQGSEPHQIPKYYYKSIKIPFNIKKQLREDLKTLFDIDNSTIYPEAYNLVQKISDKSLDVKEVPFSISTELEFTLKELEKYLDEQIGILYNSETNQVDLIRNIEKQLLLYTKAFYLYMKNHKKNKNELNEFILNYNELVITCFSYLEKNKNPEVEILEINRLLLQELK